MSTEHLMNTLHWFTGAIGWRMLTPLCDLALNSLGMGRPVPNDCRKHCGLVLMTSRDIPGTPLGPSSRVDMGGVAGGAIR